MDVSGGIRFKRRMLRWPELMHISEDRISPLSSVRYALHMGAFKRISGNEIALIRHWSIDLW